MNLLFISKDGSSLSVAERVQSEGHNSLLYLTNPNSKQIGDGMVSKPTSATPIMKGNSYIISSGIEELLREVDPDLVILDAVVFGRVADYVRKRGVTVLGACRWADDLQSDLTYSKKIMAAVDLLPLKENIKGIPILSNFWWDGLSSSLHNISYPYTTFMNDNVGKMVDFAGTVTKSVPPTSQIMVEGLTKMERLLKKTTYRGPVTLNSICTPSNLYNLSFSLGFHNTLPSLMELYRNSLTELLWSTARGTNNCGKLSSDYSISVRVTVPPYPYNLPLPIVKISGINGGNIKHIWWKGIQLTAEGQESVSSSGDILIASARGRDVIECKKRVYRTINNLIIPQKQFRTDIGDRIDKDERKLKANGWF